MKILLRFFNVDVGIFLVSVIVFLDLSFFVSDLRVFLVCPMAPMAIIIIRRVFRLLK